LHALGIRTSSPRDFLIDAFGYSVQGNLYGARSPFPQEIGNATINERSVGKQGDEKSLPLGIGVDLREILSDKWFSPREKEPETSFLGYYVKNMANLAVG